MKAILIDPFKMEVRLVDDDFDGGNGIIGQYLAQGERGPKRAPLDTGFRVASGYHSYVDDEGCYRPGQKWFRFMSAPYACAGYMLILRDRFVPGEGIYEGDVEEWVLPAVAPIVQWISAAEGEASMPPTTVSSVDRQTGEEKLISSHPIDFTDKRPLTEEL